MEGLKVLFSLDQYRILRLDEAEKEEEEVEDSEGETEDGPGDPELRPPPEGKTKEDPETGEKVYNKKNIPKEQQLVALARELYNSIKDATQFKYEIKDKLEAMKEKGAGEEDLAKAGEVGMDQQAALQARADGIEQQMAAVAADSEILAARAEELASEAKNLAGRANKEFFDKTMDKVEKDFDTKKAKKDAEGDSEDDSEDGDKEKVKKPVKKESKPSKDE